jgi:hypothetical protein
MANYLQNVRLASAMMPQDQHLPFVRARLGESGET